MAADLVTTEEIANGAVTTPKLAADSVVGGKILNETVSGPDIKNDSVGGADVRDGSIGGIDVANGSLTGQDINLFNDNQCNGETVQGTAIVNADPAVPTEYTTNWIGYAHSCMGFVVKVKRFSVGLYGVNFGFGHPSKLALVTPVANPGAPVVPAYAMVGDLGLGDFVVALRDRDGNAVDVDFQIMTY